MVSIQEPFLIKSGLKWRAYGMWIIKVQMRHHKAFYHIVDGYRNYFGQTFFGEIAFNTVIDDSSGFLKKGTSVIDWKQLWNFKAFDTTDSIDYNFVIIIWKLPTYYEIYTTLRKWNIFCKSRKFECIRI